MTLHKTFIPFRGYWSSPFARWQGSLSNAHSMQLAADTATAFFKARGISPEVLEALVLGITVPQQSSFYGAPWLAGLIGAPGITGPVVSQACATSVRAVMTAAHEIESGSASCTLAVCADRCSNGPHVLYPDPSGPGGKGQAEDWVWDNFNKDPWARNAMIQTAENVAKETGITKEEQDAMALLRASQYNDGLADDRAFQKRYMIPVELKKGRKVVGTLDTDEGIHPTTAEGLAGLRPAMEGGTVSFGTQTHPADGNAGLLVCSEARAAELSADAAVRIQLLGTGSARVKKGFMPMAVAPAARAALADAGVTMADVTCVKTHNPFAVNDVLFCREMGLAPEAVNRYGSPLVYGHPQAPTGARAVVELIEELAQAGGGLGLFSGCAAGDTAMALVLKVG